MKILVWLLILSGIIIAQTIPEKGTFKDYSLPIDQRVDDLVSRMTLEEKVSQMKNHSSAIPRLEIPEYDWWNEALHGVARAGTATVFPQAIGLAAMWNTELMFQIADVISTEARAKHHEFVRNGERNIYQGLTFWSPNINIFRDPRWGRGHETYGEDPFLTSRMSVAFIKGLQGNNPKYFKVIATPKHYAVHSGPEPNRHTFDAITNNRDLFETYLPAFEASIKEGKAHSIMCAYNRYMGEACCGSPALLKKILREDWGFDGYVVSDCGAIDDIYMRHKIIPTEAEASAVAVKSGTDLECGTAYTSLVEAVQKKYLSESEIDVAVKRLFRARFLLGMFDPPEMVEYARIPFEQNDSKAHREISFKAAQESIVLLKNDHNILPLKKDLKRVAVIGPTANSFQMLIGNYFGTPSKYVTPLNGITLKTNSQSEIIYEPGCNLIEDGPISNFLSSEILSYKNMQGLNAEIFNNANLSGEPIKTGIDLLEHSNLLWGSIFRNIRREKEFSVRWSGKITPFVSGNYKFIIECNSGCKILIDGKLIISNWNNSGAIEGQNEIFLSKDKQYDIVVEYSKVSGEPELFIKWQLKNYNAFEKAIEIARNSDAVIFCGGITGQLEGEEMKVEYEGFHGGDRTNLDIPKVQEKLLKAIHSIGNPVILVLSGGSALSINWAKENIPAILQIWYPGQEGGTALADILFGDYSPAGRLPVTFYKSVDQLPPFEDYNMKGRTYKYFTGEPLFHFGFGLSYSKFGYDNLQAPDEIVNGNNFEISVDVSNVGQYNGDEVVQLYIKDEEADVELPIHSLQGFKRIHFSKGEKKEISFTISPKNLSIVDNDGKRKVEPGYFTIYVGGIQPGTKAKTTESISKRIKVSGDTYFIE